MTHRGAQFLRSDSNTNTLQDITEQGSSKSSSGQNNLGGRSRPQYSAIERER